MTVTDFIKRKNKIIFDAFGLILVPESQIKECEQFPLDMKSDAGACPYCKVYDKMTSDNSCKSCPMFESGNGCDSGISSYYNIRSKFSCIVDSKVSPMLGDLIEQYNKELELKHD